MELSKHKLLIIGSFLAIYFIWGSTFLWNKIAVAELAPFQLACIRFSAAGILILVISLMLRNSIKITKKQLVNSAIAGLMFLAIGNGAVVFALKYVDSGFAALEISAQPLVVLVLLLLIKGKKIKQSSMIGVVLGVIGIYLLVSQNMVMTKDNALLGIGLIFMAMLSWGYGSIFVAEADLPEDSFVRTGYQMVLAGGMLFTMSMVAGETWSMPSEWSSGVTVSMVFLVILGSIVAFTAFNFLLRHVSPEKVATSTYINPIVALTLGFYYLGEQVTLQSVIASIVLLSGVYFINTKRKITIFRRHRRGV